jgi:hypothetical protein
LNGAFSKHIYIDDEYNVTAELDQPLVTPLGDDHRRAAVADADDDLREVVESALKARTERSQSEQGRDHQGELVAATPTATACRSGGRG